MNDTSNRACPSNVLAAGIVAAGLIGAALLLGHRPAPTAAPATVASTPSARPVAAPPVAQEAVQEQFRTQTLAAPGLHTFRYNGTTYTVTDVRVKRVVYTAKEDTFGIEYEWGCQPALPSEVQSAYATLNNDGYGHYFGTVSLSTFSASGAQGAQNAEVTVR